MPIQVRQHEPAVLRFTVVLVDSPYYLSDSPCNLRFSVQPEGFLRATRGFFVNPADSPCKPAGSSCRPAGSPCKPADSPGNPADSPRKPADSPCRPADFSMQADPIPRAS